MDERYAETLERLVDKIERSLDRPLSLDEISREAGLSKYHLHRVFRAITGLPLAEYVRRRRLSDSLGPLFGSDRPIIDIALDYGFSFVQSYIRAFRARYGMSPGQCRDERPLLPLTERVETGSLSSIGADGVLLGPNLVAKPGTTVCGIRHWVTDTENAERNTVASIATDFRRSGMARITEPVYASRYVGIVEHCPNPEENWYITGAELRRKPRGPAPEGMEMIPIASGRYREFVHVSRVHPFSLTWSDVQSLYAAIFGEWMPRHRDELAGQWHLEYVDLDSAREDYGEFRVLVPVV